MTFYKFRDLKNFEFVADIIMNEQLHSAGFDKLNDPMEGIFYYDNGVDKTIIDSIKAAKQKHKVCSLSEDFKHPLLWAHYADGFKGICIEIGIEQGYNVHEIKYMNETPKINNGSYSNLTEESYDSFAVRALTRKFKEWTYEGEYRLFNTDDSPKISSGIRVLSILFGVHTSDLYKEIISRIAPPSIKLYNTELGIENRIVKKEEYIPPPSPAEVIFGEKYK